MADDLRLVAKFDDKASAGVRKLGKDLAGVKPSHGMAQAQKWFAEFRGGVDQTVKAIQPVTGMMNSIGVGGLAASLSIGEMAKQFKELADSTQTLKELSRQSRISEDDLRRLRYAGSRFSLNPDAVNGAINSWSAQMVGFRIHTSKFYNELALKNADVAQKIARESPLESLKDTLDFISRIKDPQVRKMWADDAGVGDMLPMMNRGPDGLKAIFADAAREVQPMSEELKDAAERFTKSTANFKQTWENFENSIGPSVLDPMSAMLDKLDEGLKAAAAAPADAVAGATIIAGSFTAFWSRARIMRAVAGSGGAAASRAARELVGAATKQGSAGTSLLEAATALKEAAAELRGKGGPGGSPKSNAVNEVEEDAKKYGPDAAPLLLSGLALPIAGALAIAAGGAAGGAMNSPNVGDYGQDGGTWGGDGPDNSPRGAYLRHRKAHNPQWIGTRLWSWATGGAGSAPGLNTDGNALHKHDDELSPVTAQELFQKVREGSKEGIVAGLREMAQEQQLAGGGAGVGDTDGGAPSIRYGRAAGRWRTTPGRHSGGGGDHGSSGPPGIDYNAKSATEQMGISQKEWDAFREGVTDIEGKQYNHMGGAGGRYAGRYQMGPAEIDATARRLGVARPSNAQFMADPAMQERFFENYTMDHYRTLLRNKKFAAMSHREQLKILGYAHNQGTGGPTRENGAWGYLDRGAVGHDAFGTSGTAYLKTIQRRLDQSDAGSAADAFAAKRKALMGTPPQAHASGGSVRGPGGPRSDSIPVWLSNGEFVVNASAAGRFLPFLHAINAGHAYADGGLVANGATRRRSWLDFFHRSMGASRSVAFGATAMMMGESGSGLNPGGYHWDVNGPSGGTAQWHDVTKGPAAGRLHRLSDLMAFAMMQHADWKDVSIQQAWWKHEATGPLAYAWAAMRRQRTAAGALRAGINKFEVPADKLVELHKRLPNIVTLAREAGGAAAAREMDSLEVNIRHHPHTGRPIVTARAGKGVKLGIRTMPTMRPT